MRAEAVQLAVLAEGNRIRNEMLRKVVVAVGTEAKSGPRITEALPRGGALVILSARERNEVLVAITALDDVVRRASDALSKSRLLAYRAIGRELDVQRGILDLLGEEYLLGPIPERRAGTSGGK